MSYPPQSYGSASPVNAANFPTYQPSAQLLGGFSQPTPDWMGPWSPAVYQRMDTPSATGPYGGKGQNANLFEMSFRNGAQNSPALPESNTRASFSQLDESNSQQHNHTHIHQQQQQQQQQWPSQRKRALSSPALLWEGGNRAHASYFDQQPSAPYQAQGGGGHHYSHSVGPDSVQQSPQQSNNNQLQTHPAMHDSIQAISALASFNHQQQSQPTASASASAPTQHATRQATRDPPASAPAQVADSPATRPPKRARKGSNEQRDSSASPKQEENDELEEDTARPSGLVGPDGKLDPMDAEAQRKDLLDRNRIAARKSREKRKREVQALENTIRNYTSQNASLHSLTVSLSAELQQLRDLLSNHTQCVHGGMGPPMGHPHPHHHHQQHVPQPIMSGGRRR